MLCRLVVHFSNNRQSVTVTIHNSKGTLILHIGTVTYVTTVLEHT